MTRKNGFKILDRSITRKSLGKEYEGKFYPKPSRLLSDWKLWLSEGCPNNSHLSTAFTWAYTEQRWGYWADLYTGKKPLTDLDLEIYNSWRVQEGMEPVEW